MLSKNNRQYQYYKQEDKKQRFGLRKLSIGVASVLLGTTFALMGGSSVYADTPVSAGEQEVAIQQSAAPQQSAGENAQSTRETSSAASSVATTSNDFAAGQTAVTISAIKGDSEAATSTVADQKVVARPAVTEPAHTKSGEKQLIKENVGPEAKVPVAFAPSQEQSASSGDTNEVKTKEVKLEYLVKTPDPDHDGKYSATQNYFSFTLTYKPNTDQWDVPVDLNDQYKKEMNEVVQNYVDQGYVKTPSDENFDDIDIYQTSFSNGELSRYVKNGILSTDKYTALRTLYFDDPVISFMTADYKDLFNDRSNVVGVVSQEEKEKNYANDDGYVAVSSDGVINFHGKRIDISKNCHVYTRTIIFHYWDGHKETKQQENVYLKNFSYDFKTNKSEDLSPAFNGSNTWPAYELPENSYLKHDPKYLTNEPVKEVHEDSFSSYGSPKDSDKTVDVYIGQPEKVTFEYVNALTGEKLTPSWYSGPTYTEAELDPSWKGQKLADYIGKGDVEDNQPSIANRPAYPINGYKLINYDEIANQIINGLGNVTYTFKYAPLSPIVVKYVDENNNQTIYTVTIDNEGNGALPGQHYTTKQLEFPGYQFDHASKNVEGIIGQCQKEDDDPNSISVTYYYEETDKNVAQYSREAIRADERLAPFYPSFPGRHDIGTPIDYTTANQDYQNFLKDNGYTDVGGENTEAGIYTGQKNHVNYYYVKDQPVIINFLKAVKKNGQVVDTTTSVHDSQIIETGKGGWMANANALSIAGYHFDHVELGAQSADETVASGTNQSTVSGQFAVVPQQVNFYYLPQVAYNVHYRDVTTEVAGGQTTGFTPNEGSNLDYGHEVIGISGSVGDAPDNTSKLWDYRAVGYALAEGPADLGKATLYENMGDVNDRTGDQYVYLVRTAAEHTEERSASRTVHYVGVYYDDDDATKSIKVVHPSTTQKVTLTGTYYTDATKANSGILGEILVNTKTVTINGQQVMIIDPTNTKLASETWEMDSAEGVTKDGDSYVFPQIKAQAAFGKWEHYANLDQYNRSITVDPNVSSSLWQGTLSDVYLAYRQKGQYVVHYRDVTGVDKTTFTPSDGTALHDTEAISGWLNDAYDGRDQLWTKYGDEGYVIVQSDDFLAQQTITANTLDQYVYLMKVATPQTEDKVVKRVIHYVAKTVDGQSLKSDQIQQVTLTGTYYVDSKGDRVHVSERKDAQGNTIYVVSNGTPQETWAIKDDPANHDVTVNTADPQKFDFAQAEGEEAPAKITTEDGGTWYYVGQKDNEICIFDPAKSSPTTLNPIYLIYKQKGSYNIHYVDVTNSSKTSGYTSSDGVEKTSWLISNVGNDKYAGDPTDASADLADRTKDFQDKYVVVEFSPNLGKQTVEPNMKDQYVYLVHKAIRHTESKTASRTFHYVANSKTGKQLQDDTVQKVILNGIYYTDAVTGKVVHTKDFNGTPIVDGSQDKPVAEIWTVDPTTKDDLTADGKSFKEVADPATITLNKQEAKNRQVNSGDWYLTATDSNGAAFFGDPSDSNWTSDKDNELPAGYLIYKQKAQYSIHYIDVNAAKGKNTYEPTDGQELTDHQIANIGEQGYVGDTPDASSQLWNYGQAGYALVSVSDNAQNDQLGKQTLANGVQDQYVYLIHKAIEHDETKTATRTIHYVANSKGGKQLQADTVQRVTLNGVYYTDAITGELVHAIKDQDNNLVVDNSQSGSTSEVWTVDPAADSDLTTDGKLFKKVTGPNTITLTNQEAKKRQVNSGEWSLTNPDSIGPVSFGDPSDSNWTTDKPNELPAGYLVYKQKGSYNIHYVDVTGSDKVSGFTPEDGTEKTSWLISNVGNGKYAGDPTDASADLADRVKNFQDNYVIVESSPNLGQQTVEPNMQDQYVYLIHRAIQHTDTKMATRVIHYVADSKAGKQLQADTTQTVTLNGVYYTDAVTGKQVHAKKFNNTLIVDSSQAGQAEEVWTVDPATKGDLTTDGRSFKEVAGPTTITLDKQEAKNRQVNSGDWYLTTTASNGKASFGDPTNASWTVKKPNELPAGYLIYQQKAQYSIHYIDVNGGADKETYVPADGEELTSHQIVSIGAQNYVGDTPDVTSQLWNYGQAGYVLVSVSSNAKNGQLGKQTLTNGVQDQYVYLKHGLQTKATSKKVNETIHYVYQDGSQARTDYVATPLTFTHTVKIDQVTGETVEDDWTDTQLFAKVDSPQIAGYTPDQAQIDSQSVDHNSKDLEFTVTYAPLTYTVTVHYADEDGNVIKDPLVVGTGYTDGTTYATSQQKPTVITKNGQTYNYVRVALGDPATGVINGHNIDVTYVYQLQKTQPTQPSGQPTQPSGQPTQPSGEPTQPSGQPTQPSGEPTQPSGQPTQPSGEPTQPSGQPTQPSGQPTQPSGQPTQPSGEPTQPSGQPTQPSGEPTQPSGQPTQPSGEPTQPSGQPTQPSGQPTQPSGQPTQLSGSITPKVDKPSVVTQQKRLPQTGNNKRLAVGEVALGVVSALAGLVLGKKRRHE